jgi:hypothetical protein
MYKYLELKSKPDTPERRAELRGWLSKVFKTKILGLTKIRVTSSPGDRLPVFYTFLMDLPEGRLEFKGIQEFTDPKVVCGAIAELTCQRSRQQSMVSSGWFGWPMVSQALLDACEAEMPEPFEPEQEGRVA